MSGAVIRKNEQAVEAAAKAAVKPANWPAWLTPLPDGESAAVDLGSKGQVIVTLTSNGVDSLALDAAQEGAGLPAIRSWYIAMFREGVRQWDTEKMGSLWSSLSDEQAAAEYDRMRRRDRDRIQQGIELLAKN